MKARTFSRPGFALLEIALVLGLLAIVAVLSAAVMLGAFRIERAASASQVRQSHLATLADQFRADVAQAVAAPDQTEKLTANAACLILRNADGRHVVYRWHSDRLERFELAGANESARRLMIKSDYGTVEFSRHGKDHQVLTLRLLQPVADGSANRPLEIAAALGGDHQ